MEEIKELYLDLMKRSLTNWLYIDKETAEAHPQNLLEKKIIQFLKKRGLSVVTPRRVELELRMLGQDAFDGMGFPASHTMIGFKRLDNIRFCIESILQDNIPGDLIETGVWQGGAAIFMRAILKVLGVKNRIVWVADSFEGCPKPNTEKYPQDTGLNLYTNTNLAVSLETVKSNFERYGLLDDQVRFVKGWFKDTLPASPICSLSLLRIDGDLYESTTDVLVNLYTKVSKGGFIIVDDFIRIPACQKAIQDFRKKHAISSKIVEIDMDGIYWRRT